MARLGGAYILFLFLWMVYAFFIQYPNVNQLSRYDATLAIIREGTPRIDTYHENTIDKAYYKGHYYSDKAPGLSLLAVPVYAGLDWLQNVKQQGVWDGYPLAVLTALTVSLFGAALGGLFYLLALDRAGSPALSILATIALALGTIVFPYATMFFGHVVAAFLLFAAFAAIWSVPQGQATLHLFLSGLSTGLAILVEYPSGLPAAIIALYAASKRRRLGDLLAFVGGIVPGLLILGWYNWWAFGSPFQLSYWYSIAVPTEGLMRQGILGVTAPSLDGLWILVLGPRGLLTLSPVLALAIPGVMGMWRRGWRAESLVIVAISAGLLLSTSGFFNPIGGGGPGPRFVIPALPFATLTLAFLPPRWRGILVVLTTVSCIVMLVATATNPQAPITVGNPLVDYWLPHLQRGEIVYTQAALRLGIRSVVALIALLIPAVWAAVGLVWLTKGQLSRRAWTLYALVGMFLFLIISFPINLMSPTEIPSMMVRQP
jgi:hypothetical protein